MLERWKAVFRRQFIQGNREQGILDTLYQILASPSEGLRGIIKWRPWGWAILTAVFISLVVALTTLPNPSDFTRVIFSLEKGSVSFIPALILWASILLVALLASAGILHLIALLLRGRGSYLGILCGLSFAAFPAVLLAPLALLRALLGSPGTILYFTGALLLFFWIMVLQIIAIRHNYGFPMGRAIATYFIPSATVLITLISVAAVNIAL